MLQIPVPGLQKLIKWLFGIFCMLLFLNILVSLIGYVTGHFSMYGILDLFEFNKERNFPTYFSSVNLLFASLLLFAIYRFSKRNALGDSRYWLSLSIIFLCLSIDEFASVHERLNDALQASFSPGGFFYYAWVIPGIIICLILAIYFIKFFLRLPRRYQTLFFLSALLFVGGAVGMEMVDGYLNSSGTRPDWLLFISFTIKESMEMTGVILFLYSLTDYIKMNMQAVPAQQNQ